MYDRYNSNTDSGNIFGQLQSRVNGIGWNESIWEIKSLLKEIEKSPDITETQKIGLQQRVSQRSGSHISELRQGAYNILLLFRNNATAMLKKQSLASVDTLIKLGIVYQSYEMVELSVSKKDGYMTSAPAMSNERVIKLTAFGKSIISQVCDRAMEYATKEKRRLEILGLV